MLSKICGLYIIRRLCEKVAEECPWSLEYVPDKLKMQRVCEKGVEKNGSLCLRYAPNDLRFRVMCEKIVGEDPWSLRYVPDNLKMQEMCKKAMHNRLETFFFHS